MPRYNVVLRGGVTSEGGSGLPGRIEIPGHDQVGRHAGDGAGERLRIPRTLGVDNRDTVDTPIHPAATQSVVLPPIAAAYSRLVVAVDDEDGGACVLAV